MYSHTCAVALLSTAGEPEGERAEAALCLFVYHIKDGREGRGARAVVLPSQCCLTERAGEIIGSVGAIATVIKR